MYMGIITVVKQKVKKEAIEIAKKGADAVAVASQFSPKQIEEVDKKREQYLQGMPSSDDDAAQILIERNLGAIGIEIYQAYLPQIGEIYTPVNTSNQVFDVNNRIMYFDITRWVLDVEENHIDKLVNVYNVLCEEDCNIALIYHRTKINCQVKLAVVNNGENDSALTKSFKERLIGAIKGNFPGVEMKYEEENGFGVGTPECLVKTEGKSVATVSNLAAEKSEKFISQSMEKLLDGIVPENDTEEYTMVLLATPIKEQLEKKNRLYGLYSTLMPYSTWQTSYTYTESDAINAQASFGVNIGASAGGQWGQMHSTGEHHDINHNVSDIEGVAREADKKLDKDNELLKKSGEYYNNNGEEKTRKLAKGRIAKFVQKNAPIIKNVYSPVNVNSSRSESNGSVDGMNQQNGVSYGTQASANFGMSFSRASSVTAQIGKNEGIIQNYNNYGVSHTLEIIEEQMKRLEQCSALGMWNFASYVISGSPVIANNVAHMYLALTQGEESYMTQSAINLWHGTKQKSDAITIVDSLTRLQHPMFRLKDSLEENWYMYPTLVDASTTLSGKELAYAMNFPRKSVSGLPVVESVSFGRDVHKFSLQKEHKKISVGEIYHMRRSDGKKVSLDLDSLCSHTFITGSTGSGKSNTVYDLLWKLRDEKKPFLVIEPAKGEYKNIFGGYEDVSVLGTNPLIMPLLQISPFSFPNTTHVLEHIDRLIEIFNACWPMYAAMPAVLKDAVERCYKQKGWDLNSSTCEPVEFPTFFDLLESLPLVMNESLFSADTKSDYAGALITRVKSLTNGINGQVLCSTKDIFEESKELFEGNVLIDISRVGSMETKSLLMGILVMKLQEYRMHLGGMNKPLTHVTVLEEAHNLLRRTSNIQSQEGSNLQGKSVEMISNAIAEMRTYGEGFIIVDQAPALLDESVIRNTNTKIILRLPDESDRILVGKSEALTENQINELARLPQGVAAVYQNDWVEAVLCKFDEFPENQKKGFKLYRSSFGKDTLKQFFYTLFEVKDVEELKNEQADYIKKWINSMHFSRYSQSILIKTLEGQRLSENEKFAVSYNVFDGKRMAAILENTKNEEKALDQVRKAIHNMHGINDNTITDIIMKMSLQVIYRELGESNLEKRYKNIEIEGRML